MKITYNNQWQKLFNALFLLMTVLVTQVQAQQRTVSGIVKDETTLIPIIGASVTTNDRTKSTLTDEKGSFTLQVDGATKNLQVSFIGYKPQIIAIGDINNLNVLLSPTDAQIEEVVVTALGISREQKSLTYSTQQLGGDELTRAKGTNLINSINGKVAGVNINASSSGVGGSAKVVLRGNKSASGSNQVLYVIDGVPMNNNSVAGQPTNIFGGERDPGDPISLINPEDIESMSVLKGASAAALYGSQAANGVILITTKSGKNGRTSVDFSSSAQIETPAVLPDFQNNYGRGSNGTSNTGNTSWGPQLQTPGTNDVNSFYSTGTNFTNSIAFSRGNEHGQTYLSYANTSANGLLPENTLNRHNINLKQSANFFDDKLTVEGGVNYMLQDLNNAPLTGFYFNPIVGLYLLPPDQDLNSYKTFETFDVATNQYTQNWYSLGDSETTQQNPWWIQNRNTSLANKDRVILNGSAKYKANSWLTLQARGSMDRTNDLFERQNYAGTQSILAPANGNYSYSKITITQKYADFIANINTNISDKLKINGLIGTSISDWGTEGISFSTGGTDGLTIPNIFEVQNSTDPIISNSSANRRQLQSVFASANLAYDDWLYLDLTARNDWSSTLAFTETPSFFYPSVGLSANIHEKLNLPSFINFMKVRGSYARVGNDLPAYQTNLQNTLGNLGNITINTTTFLETLEPEMTNSFEAGTEIKMFNSKFGIDFTYYKTNTTNQYFLIAASEASLFGSYAVNAGNIQNEGLELLLTYDAIKNENFSWTTALNYSQNKNTIVELSDEIDEFTLSNGNRNNYISKFEVGGSFGDIYGADFQRDDQGRIIISDGIPLRSPDYIKLGNSNPRWQMGWSNTLNYKNLGLYFLIDGKFDYQVFSVTEALMDSYGVSARTGAARDAGGVAVNAVDPSGNAITSVDPQTWYTSVGGIGPVTSEYIYNGSAIRLREFALSYNFKLDHKFVKGLRVAATGRNLFFFYKEAPFDPETTMSTGNSLSGIDIFMMPSSRSYGLSLNVNF